MGETQTYVIPDQNQDKWAMFNALNNNQWNNNPFMYLIWIYMMRFMGWNDGNGYYNNQITALQEQIADNHNSDLLMQAVRGNEAAIREFSATTGLNFSAVQNAICGVKSAIGEVAAQLGFSSERVINAVQQGDCAVSQAVKDVGCGINQNILKMGFENQLANERQTNILNQGIYGLSTSLDRNAAAIEYNSATQTCTLQNAIKDASSASTAAILAKLDNMENSRKDREIQTLTAQLAAVQARSERQAELAPIMGQIAEVRRNQPSTTVIEYPQLTAVPTAALYGASPYNNGTGYWG